MDSRSSNSLRIRVPFDAMLKGKKLWKRWISFFIYILLCLHEKLFARIDCWIVILFLLIIEVVIVIILIVNIYRVVENKSKNKNRSSLLAGLFKIKRKEEEEGKSWGKKFFKKKPWHRAIIILQESDSIIEFSNRCHTILCTFVLFSMNGNDGT